MNGKTPWLLSGFLLWAACPGRAVSSSASAALPSQELEKPATVSRGFVLDPGHGGYDSGAVVRNVKEKDLALAIARKVQERLQRLVGRPVRLTRDADEYIPLNERIEESRGSAAFISLHLNQTRSKRRQGITVYAFGERRRSFHFFRRRHPELTILPSPPRDIAQESREFAGAIVRSLRRKGFHVDSPGRARFYVLKNPNAPSVLIEMGYLSNPKEAARLTDPAYQDRLAEALAESLASSYPMILRADGSLASNDRYPRSRALAFRR